MRLIGKLRAYGIDGNLLNWVTEYLAGISQVVMVNGVKSVRDSHIYSSYISTICWITFHRRVSFLRMTQNFLGTGQNLWEYGAGPLKLEDTQF